MEPADSGEMMARYHCLNCCDLRWVCEDHMNKPWPGAGKLAAEDHGRKCSCGGAGLPCQSCNTEAPAANPPGPDWAGFASNFALGDDFAYRVRRRLWEITGWPRLPRIPDGDPRLSSYSEWYAKMVATGLRPPVKDVADAPTETSTLSLRHEDDKPD
jgi:hypothetical protein